jgi:hypothetical protein
VQELLKKRKEIIIIAQHGRVGLVKKRKEEDEII